MTTLCPKKGASTSSELVRFVVNAYREHDFPVAIIESSTPGRPLKDVYAAYDYFGLDKTNVSWLDACDLTSRTIHFSGIPPIELPEILLESTSVLVNLPVIKRTPLFEGSGPLKNLIGLVATLEKQQFHPVLDRILFKLPDYMNGRLITIADASYCWIGDFENGKAVPVGNLICSMDILEVEETGKSLLYSLE
jgi:uncharacterized protein (DUF362 family)